MAPPGGEPDTEPPRIVETEPAQNAQVAEYLNSTRPVRIIFDETLSERSPREMVLVSPETGEVHVERDDNELRVTIEGGWKEGRVYRITVLPGLLDRRGNARSTAYDLVFSTGAPISANALGGIATDRITGRPAIGARVEAISGADSTVYTTVTDSGGFFSFRSLPVAVYNTRVFTDQNRNRRMDAFEARAATNVRIGTASDTMAVELALLPPDSTPARLLRADIRDSLQVRLLFDDYLDPTGSLPPVRISAWQLPDSILVSGGSVLSPRNFETQRAAAAAARDTARTPPALPSTGARADTTRILPFNELVWVPPQPLVAGARYRITVAGYRNILNIPDGGGSVVATVPAARPPAPAPPTPAAPDTARQ
jgi:hypothetical protein